jgi:hypothetical protein
MGHRSMMRRKNRKGKSKEEEEVERGDLSVKTSLSKKELLNMYGTISIKCKYDYTKMKVFSGDEFYEQRLRLMVEKKQKHWMEKMKDAVEAATERHIDTCRHAHSLLESLRTGWLLRPNLVVDVRPSSLSLPCIPMS